MADNRLQSAWNKVHNRHTPSKLFCVLQPTIYVDNFHFMTL